MTMSMIRSYVINPSALRRGDLQPFQITRRNYRAIVANRIVSETGCTYDEAIGLIAFVRHKLTKARASELHQSILSKHELARYHDLFRVVVPAYVYEAAEGSAHEALCALLLEEGETTFAHEGLQSGARRYCVTRLVLKNSP